MSSIKAIALAKVVGGGSGDIEIEALSVTQNGMYNPGSSKAYKPVNVNVPNSYVAGDEGKVVSGGALVEQTTKQITANGTVNTTTNNEVVVSVQPNLQQKIATQNGDVTPDSGYDGLSKVIVNVSTGGSIIFSAIEPLDRMHTASYMDNMGRWYGSANEGNNVIEVYEVIPGHKYLYVLGEVVNVAYLCTSTSDPRAVTSGTLSMSNIIATTSPKKRLSTNVEPSNNYIYFVAQIANRLEYASIRGYLFDITDFSGTV